MAILLVPILFSLVFLLAGVAESPAQDTVLRRGDSVLSRDVTLADAAKYSQLSVDATGQMWAAFSKSLPASAETFKNALTMLVLVDTMSSGVADPKRYQKVLKIIADFGAGALVTAYEDAGYMPLATINTLFTLYNESLIFFRDRVFLPGLADEFYDVYKSHRLSGDPMDHAAAWNLTHIPEPIVADVALNVILKQRGLEPGLYEGLKFDKEHLSKAGRSATGSAAGRTIRIDAQPGTVYSAGRTFLINRDIGKLIEIKAGFVDGYEQQMLSIMNTITTRDLDQRKDADTSGYAPLSASDEKALEAEIRSLFERMKSMNMGEKLRDEALEYIGQTYKLRYQQELTERVLRERSAAAKKALTAEAKKLQTYSWVRLVTVKGLGVDGEPRPIDGAALFVDEKLCLSDTNGGKPCATNRIGLAALHLLPGGHDIQARAPGFKPAEIRIVSDMPDTANPSPDEYEIVLQPDAPRDLALIVRSGRAEGDEGPPLAGARLTLLLPDGKQLPAVTNELGKAEFKAVPPGGPYRLTATAEAHAPGDFRDLSFGDEPLALGLEPLRTNILVTVLDLEGRALPGAVVQLGESRRQSDESGIARFENMPPSPEGGYTLTASFSGLPPASATLVVRPKTADETLRSTLSFQVKTGILAVVRDAENRIVPGAVVIVEGPEGRTQHTTDANGYARLQDLPLGAHYLHAEAPGFQPAPDTEILLSIESPMGKARLELLSGVSIKVIVIGPDGSPLSGAMVQMDGGQAQRAATGSVSFSGVKPGKHVFTASSDLGKGTLEAEITSSSSPTSTLQLHLLPTGGSLLVQVRDGQGRALPGANIVLTKNSKPYGMKSGSDALFENLPEGYYNAEASLSGYATATSESISISSNTPRRTIALRLAQEPEPVTARGKLRHMIKEQVEGNTYQYSGIAVDVPGGPSHKVAFSHESKASVLSAFCATVNGVPAAKQRQPHVGSTAGKTYDLSGRLICDGKAQGGVTCATYMSITCVVEPECKPGDPKCDPNAQQDTDKGGTPPPSGKWSYSSYGTSGDGRTYRFVKLDGKIVSATDPRGPAAFCSSQGLAPVAQPSGNVTNWQGALINTAGETVCKTKNAGGSESVCRGYKDITCGRPPAPGAGAPCDPNEPLCGLDQDL